MKLTIKSATGGTFGIEVEASMKISEVKEVICSACEVPANQQRLIYSGKVRWRDSGALSSSLDRALTRVHRV